MATSFRSPRDGRAARVDDTALTPFVCVTFYNPLSHDEIDREMDYDAFLKWLGTLLPSSNLFFAIRVEGLFSQVRVRSVPKQESYRPLVEIAAEQPVFDFQDIKGTLAGFFTPSFMSSVNVPGLHLHFLSADLQKGGHLLECRPRKIRVRDSVPQQAGTGRFPSVLITSPSISAVISTRTWKRRRNNHRLKGPGMRGGCIVLMKGAPGHGSSDQPVD